MSYAAPKNGFRTFLVLWASQGVSAFGTALTFFAINIWLVQTVYAAPEQQAQLGWALAAVGLSAGLPSTIVTPFAGAMADRVDRKRLMMIMDLVSGAIGTVVTLLMIAGTLEVWMVLVAIAGMSMSAAFHGVAFDTSYAMLVTDEQLPRANGMMQTMWSLSTILSPAIAATIISLPILARQGLLPGSMANVLAPLQNGAALALGLDSLTFLAAAVVLAFLAIPSPKRADLAEEAGKKPTILADVRFGITYILQRRPLLWLLGTFAVVNLGLQMGVFLPLLVKFELAADWAARGFSYETAFAAMSTAMAAGGLTGGFLVSLWGGAKRNRVLVLMLAMLATGVLQVSLGFSSIFYLAIGVIFFWNFFGPVSNAHSQAIWQSQVPREMQGRVFAVRRVVAWSLGPIGQIIAGLLVGLFSPGVGMALLGGLIAVTCFGMLFNKQVMRVEDKAYLDRLAEAAAVGN